MTTQSADKMWANVPSFSARLAAAMDYAGLTNRQLSDRLRDLGLGAHPQQVHRLLKGRGDQGRQDRPANPTFITIACCAKACGVQPQWFFADQDALSEDYLIMLDRYAASSY